MSETRYAPLRISCYAVNAIASDGYLPLDGILAALWMRENHPDAYYNDSVGAKDNLIEADLPLARLGVGADWYYACSFCDAEWVAEDVTHWHKRNTITEQTRYLGDAAQKLNLAAGATKAYRMPLYLLSPGGRLTWYAVGDAAWLKSRLLLVTNVGKKRAQGHGEVIDWQVEEVAEDWSVLKDGRLMRAVPFGGLPEGAEVFQPGSYALRPPYWHFAHQRDSLLLPVRRGTV